MVNKFKSRTIHFLVGFHFQRIKESDAKTAKDERMFLGRQGECQAALDVFKSRCLTPRQLNLFAAVIAAAHVPGNIIGIGKTARRSEPSKYVQFQSGAYKPESDDSDSCTLPHPKTSPELDYFYT